MGIFSIPTDLSLPSSAKVELFIFQWFTPLPQVGAIELPDALVGERREILNGFKNWLASSDAGSGDRPIFIVIPELSFPRQCVTVIEELFQASNRSLVLIAGMEYLNWEEYKAYINNYAEMPEPAKWLAGGQPNSLVNAVLIWIKGKDGTTRKFIQPKRYPNAAEQALSVYSGQHTLVFTSHERISGKRLNFITQVCSDFTSNDNVDRLRKEIAESLPDTLLDFTFLPQLNEDQEANQFKQAIQEYYGPPILRAVTTQSTLVFANGSNEKHGKSSSWGCSGFHFHYEKRWRLPSAAATSTYWLQDRGAHNHQAMILRERGPGIYRLIYKPHSLVPRIPGSGQEIPFINGEATFVAIKGGDLSHALFSPIAPAWHWVDGEWSEGEAKLAAHHKTKGVPDLISKHWQEHYSKTLIDWRSVLSADDNATFSLLKSFFVSCQGGYPCLEHVEPNQWCDDAGVGIKEFQAIYALLYLGRSILPGGQLNPAPAGVCHATSGSTLGVSLIWGGHSQSPHVMVAGFLNALRSTGVSSLLAKDLLVVIVAPDYEMTASQIQERVPLNVRVDHAEPPTGAAHLNAGGSVVRSPSPNIRLLNAGNMSAATALATDPAAMKLAIETLVKAALQ